MQRRIKVMMSMGPWAKNIWGQFSSPKVSEFFDNQDEDFKQQPDPWNWKSPKRIRTLRPTEKQHMELLPVTG